MEDEPLEMEHDAVFAEETGDLGASLLARYQNSAREDHQHLCAVVGAMSQELRDQKIPLAPVAYFGAALSTLSRLSSGSDPVVAALLTVLSAALPKVSFAVLGQKGNLVAETVGKTLNLKSVSPVAVKAGLKCISHLIVAGDKGSWPTIAGSYGILVGFVTDSRLEVRKHSHSCLHDVLQSLHGSPVLERASEGIANLFERSFSLAGRSSSSSSAVAGDSKGAMEVLYILAALRECLALMSMKFTNSILKCFKLLLELRQPIVTNHIINIMQAFCTSPSSEAAPEILLDVLCSLGASATENEKSADAMTLSARLLHVGIRKVYFLNRHICVLKLPTIFKALGEILACQHEEAIFAAAEGMKGLIDTCVDEPLIKEGVDRLKSAMPKNPGPTIIGKISAIVENLLGYQYNAVWDMSFLIVSSMFDKLGRSCPHLMRGSIESLGEMQKLPDEDLVYRKQLLECVGSAVRAMGPEAFLTVLSLNLDAEDLSDANVWLLPILRQYIVGAHLSYFTSSILGLVRHVRLKSKKLESQGKIVSSKSVGGLVYSLWSLLPAFCNYPVDTADSFEHLKTEMCIALRADPDLRGIICSSLQLLIQQNKGANADSSNNEKSIHEQLAVDFYSEHVKYRNISAIKASCPDFFSALSEIFIQSPNDSGGCLQKTITELASISDSELITDLFKKKAAEQSGMDLGGSSNHSSVSLTRTKYLDLAKALLPGLGIQSVQELYDELKPLLQHEGLVQKKAYKILSKILEEREEFLLSNLDDLKDLMIVMLPHCHFSAKRYRLDCLYFFIVQVSKDASEGKRHEVVTSFLTEIILALKEANKKTRNRAYDLLVKIGHACENDDQDGDKEKLHGLFNMVAVGLAGETPHMISAAIKGLARLAYEFSDLIINNTAYSLLPSAFLLLQRKNREITKANLGLLKVLVAKSQEQSLQKHLRAIVEGLMKWQDETKKHFKAKIKLLLQMLVKKCGLDAVKSVMPEEHMKLLTSIRKIKEREERKIAAKSVADGKSFQSRATTSRFSRWNHTDIFSDVGDGDMDSDQELMDTKTVSGRGSNAASSFTSKGSTLRSMRIHRTAKSLPEDLSDQLGDDPLDLLDRKKTRSALQSLDKLKRKLEPEDDVEIDSEGRLVIHDEDHKPKKRESLSDFETETGSQISNYSYSTTKSLKKGQKRRKTSDSGWANTGKEYTSKKASGDVKRKGKLEPYAYWPLDRKMLSRRPEQKAVARKGMSSVIKLMKKMEGKSASTALSASGPKFKKVQKKSHKKRR